MTDWLMDTLLWTAALIAVVLVLRRPVAKWFGPHAAYALWALPVARLLLPPIELPAWLNTAPAENSLSDVVTFTIIESTAPIATLGPDTAAPLEAAQIAPLPMLEIGIAAWLIGAATFLFLRFRAYFQLRHDLLDEAREVGRDGRIRLLESPNTNAPLAFGVIDPVIALPVGFMAQHDRLGRDLAIAHEISHHRAHDLLINVLVQPLFALHWFNPLAHYGWLALRRDQEAACDARVVEAKPADERAAYASLIASTAVGPTATLAAPMACPVLGDKSIVHRLRSLKMTDISRRRRFAGYGLLGAAALALPLTASITYAEAPAVDVPVAPIAPAAPAAPGVSVAPPAPPAPPAPMAPPAAPLAPLSAQAIAVVDPDTGEERKVHKHKDRIVIQIDDDEKGGHKKKVIKKEYKVHTDGRHLSDEELSEIMVEVRESLAEVDEVLAETDVIVAEALAEAGENRTEVRMECSNDSDEVSTVIENENGRTVLICKTRIMAQALSGLKEAREQIANDSEMSDRMRQQVLETLDAQIERWEEREG